MKAIKQNYSKELKRDPENITYSAEVLDEYEESGKVRLYLQQKYKPIIESIVEYIIAIGKSLKNTKLLDIGIGYGAFLKLCEESGFKKLYGMDPYPTSIAIARCYVQADLRVGKIEKLPWPFKESYFDVITCLDVVEHLQYPKIFFENVKRYITNDNGIVVVRTPNGAFSYRLRKLPLIGIKDNNPTHINVHHPNYWRMLAEKSGFKIIKEWKGEHLTHIKGMKYIDYLCRKLKIDHRKIPLLNEFEQAYIMILSYKDN